MADMHNINEVLANDILMEILVRLSIPCLMVQCKWVCKRWNSIISDPDFITRRIKNQLKLADTNQRQNLTIFMPGSNQMVMLNREVEGFDRFSLSFLPCYQEGKKRCIVASCEDLLLCSTAGSDDYYVCNPVTKNWVAIPPPPPRHGVVPTGFVCDPYTYVDDQDGTVTVNPHCRFRIARAFGSSYDQDERTFNVDVFSSETGEWRSMKASRMCPFFQAEYPATRYVVTYNGKLHFQVGRSVVVYDPYTNNVCDDIDPPLDPTELEGYYELKESLFVSNGSLWLCQLFMYDTIPFLFTWKVTPKELALNGDNDDDVNYKAHYCWSSRRHGTHLDFYHSRARGIMESGRVLAMHPTNPDILFLMPLEETNLYWFDFRTGPFERMGVSARLKHSCADWSNVFPLTIPI